MLDRDTFEAIEAYALGTMPAAEREHFEERLRTDPALRAELEQQRDHIRAVELGGLQRALKDIAQQQAASGNRRSWTPYLKVAAAVAVVMCAALWYALRPTTGERLYAAHFSPDPGLPVAMSAADDHAFQDAMVAYKLEDYAEARAKWSALLTERPQNDTLRYYTAMAALGAKEVRTAIPLLEAVRMDASSPFADQASWYLFLAYTHEGDTTNANTIRFDPADAHAAAAATIQQAWR
ncbi:MAG TPA: hypothetical protein PKN30_01730 [Flavobacteriales bacterium]|nr:hypothetical protein [Flavobacteriales bacterium]